MTATTNPIILLLNGPNLDLLGTREPEIYGSASLNNHVEAARKVATDLGFELESFQSASEAELVSAIHKARSRAAAIVFNPGAFTHYAWAIADALAIYEGPVVEVHLSNPNAREAWRHTSVISPVADGTIAGFGSLSYQLGIQAAAAKLALRSRS